MGPVENRNLEVSLILDINRSRGQRPYVRLDDDPTQPFILHLPLNWVGQMYAPIIGRDKPLTDEPNLEHILKFNLWWLTQVWARSRMTPLNFQTDGDNLGERIIKNNYGPATALGVLVMNDRRFGNSNKLRTWQERILGKESEHWVTLLIEPVVTEIGLYRQQSNPPTHSGGQG
jgi:hypothetical protein